MSGLRFSIPPFGMRLVVGFLELFEAAVRINLGSGQTAMPKQVFDRIEVGTPVEQVRRERMPEYVRAFLFKRSNQR